MRACRLTTAAVTVLAVTLISCFAIYINYVSFTTPKPESEPRCQHIKMATEQKSSLSLPKTPPWTSTESAEHLYVWANGADTRRLGNRLFNYASIFGIGWRNRHTPILPDTAGNERSLQQYDLARFFSPRIPVDQGNRIARVNKIPLLCRAGMWSFSAETETRPRPRRYKLPRRCRDVW